MNKLMVKQMGKVVAGVENDGEIQVYTLESKNIPVPIVLWDQWKKDAGVLCFNIETRGLPGTYNQKIDYLYSPAHGMTDRLKSMFDVYPITFKYHGLPKKDIERTLNTINDVYTKDVNGDGIDELILTRYLGGVEVYDREKLISKYTPETRPKLFEYKTERVFHATVDHHDEMFFVAWRTPYGYVENFSEGEKNFYKNTPNYRIVRVSPEGITEIRPFFPDHKAPKTIEAVAALNKPGATGIDELILVTTIEGQEGYYLSRHTLTGNAIDAPRKIYAEDYNPIFYRYTFVPQSNQVIAHSGQRQRLYFITPGKPLNWIKTVKLNRLPGGGNNTVIVGQTKKNGIPVAVLNSDNTLYAIDANGKFHASGKPGSAGYDKPVALATIKPMSKLHKIVAIRALDQSMDNILVIQSREPGKRELSIEELEKAGERFLSDSEWKHCKDDLKIEYDESDREFVEFYCKQHKIPMPEIHTLEDIRNKLPGYYQERVKDTNSSYQIRLNTRLFRPIENENYSIDQSSYKNKKEYTNWLVSASVASELVVNIHNLQYRTVTSETLADYYFTHMDSGGMAQTQDPINIRATGDHGQAFMVLHKKIFNKYFKPAFYSIVW